MRVGNKYSEILWYKDLYPKLSFFKCDIQLKVEMFKHTPFITY